MRKLEVGNTGDVKMFVSKPSLENIQQAAEERRAVWSIPGKKIFPFVHELVRPFFDFWNYGMREDVWVMTDSCDHPRDLFARQTAAHDKRIVLHFVLHVQFRHRRIDRAQEILEVFVERLEICRQTYGRHTIFPDDGGARVLIERIRRFDE